MLIFRDKMCQILKTWEECLKMYSDRCVLRTLNDFWPFYFLYLFTYRFYCLIKIILNNSQIKMLQTNFKN